MCEKAARKRATPAFSPVWKRVEELTHEQTEFTKERSSEKNMEVLVL